MVIETAMPGALAGVCYRCGYDLRDIPDASPCPECGLLAIRSRRETEELHNTRPGYLRSLAWGGRLLLLTIIAALVLPLVALGADILNPVNFFNEFFNRHLVYLLRPGPYFELLAGFAGLAILNFVAILLLTRPERYPHADRADAALRWLLRIVAGGLCLGLILILTPTSTPGAAALQFIVSDDSTAFLFYCGLSVLCFLSIIGAMLLRRWRRSRASLVISLLLPLSVIAVAIWLALHFPTEPESPQYGSSVVMSVPTTGESEPGYWLWYPGFAISLISLAILPFALFRRFRSLAVRIHSAHLAEHCTIVGVGASLASVYGMAMLWLDGLAPDSISHAFYVSSWWTLLNSVLITIAIVLIAGALYLFVRFVIAFEYAHANRRGAWRRDDRALD